MPRCRDCQAPIEFRETPAGRLQPVNADGTVHFGSCSVRRANRPTYPEDLCMRCESHNTQRGPGVGQHYASLRCNECGAFRWLRRPEQAGAAS